MRNKEKRKMTTSIILFTLAKHLNKAALEIEELENAIIKQKVADATLIEEAVSNFAKPSNDACSKIEVSNGTEKTSEEADKSSETSAPKEGLQVAKKATSSKKAPKASKEEVAPMVEVNVPPPIPQVETKRQLTAEIVKAECQKVIAAKGKPVVVEMLKNLSAEKFSQIKESDYEILFNACRLALGESDEF